MSKTRFFSFIWIFLIFLVQNAVGFVFFQAMPPLLLAGVIFYALLEGPLFGLIIGCYAGFFLDLLGTGRPGSQMAIFGMIGVLSGLAASKVFRESILTQIFLPALGYYLVTVLNLVSFKVISHEEALGLGVLREAFLWRELVFTAFFSPFVFWFLKKVS